MSQKFWGGFFVGLTNEGPLGLEKEAYQEQAFSKISKICKLCVWSALLRWFAPVLSGLPLSTGRLRRALLAASVKFDCDAGVEGTFHSFTELPLGTRCA